jgi:chromosome segregation ATPase
MDMDLLLKRLDDYEDARKRQFNFAMDDLQVKMDEREKRAAAQITKLIAKEETRDKEITVLRDELNTIKNEIKSYVKEASTKAQHAEAQLLAEQQKYQMLSFQYQHELQFQQKEQKPTVITAPSITSKTDIEQVMAFLRTIHQSLAIIEDKVSLANQEITQSIHATFVSSAYVQEMTSKEEFTAKQLENLVTEVTTSKEARWKRIEGLTTKVFNLEEKFEAFQTLLKKSTDEMQSVNSDITNQIQTMMEVSLQSKSTGLLQTIFTDGGKSNIATRAKRQKKA